MLKKDATARCHSCPHSKYGGYCSLLFLTDFTRCEKCILDYDIVKNIKPNSIEEFLFDNGDIKPLLQFSNKGKPLNVGDIVMTLRAGFGSSDPGKLLRVVDTFPSGEYKLENIFHKVSNNSYGLRKDWWMVAFKIEGSIFENKE